MRKWLIAWADKHDYNIYTDGLVVRTTLDSRLQNWAQQAVNRQMQTLQGIANNNWSHRDGWSADNALVLQLVRETEAFRKLARSGRPSDISEEEALKKLLADKAFMRQLREDKTRVQAGFLAIDPRTSAVLAWVGSRDYAQDAFDHVAQARRQPGSTFKPFVYGAALQRGARPDDTRKDEAVEIQLPGGEVWRPSDAVEPTGVPMKLSDALAYSKNTITAELGQEVGMDRVIKLARALGVRQSPLEPVPSLALGSSPVTLLEMVNAYGSIANSGHYIPPQLVTRIENADGELLAEFTPPKPDQVWDEEENYGLLEMMRAVIDKGTGRAIRKQYGIRADVAGKTGTTQGNADGWFILMHPQIVAGAWAGFNDARITLKSDQWGQGSRSALPMVGDFMSRALRSPLLNAKARFTEPNTSHWWSDLVGRLRDKLQQWSGPADEGHSAPTTPAHPAPNRSNGSEVDIIESTPAAPPSTAVQPAPADSNAQPPDLDSSPGLAPGEMMPAPARTPRLQAGAI